ncbi:hypothetical protein KP509_02G009300 [Ceratopteris richardii]|uniref:VOC domain-containing protein n=1 Tax=Ceratopteris richardii TaxID=49495 RepID=A0A8T2V3C9_CERRI|nr:hypothetical protein KP509_02G009300 [Ceratopteris richardii]
MGEQEQTNNGKQASCVYKVCIPQLVIEAPRAADAISFYKRAFGAEEVAKTLHKRKAGQELPLILHAHLKFGSAEIMLCDEVEESGPNVQSPNALKGTTAIMHVVTNDVDAAFAKALEAGAKETEPVADQPWGVRYGKVVDPFGFSWSFGTPFKELHAEETPAA